MYNTTTGKKPQLKKQLSHSAQIRELQRQFIERGEYAKLYRKLYGIAMDDSHPQQGVALRIMADRMFHTSFFEQDKASSAPNAIQINITTVAPPDRGRAPIEIAAEDRAELPQYVVKEKRQSVEYSAEGDIMPDDEL